MSHRSHQRKVKYSSKLPSSSNLKNVLVARLNSLGQNDLAEELSGQVEGDMLIGQREWTAFNGRVDHSMRWRNNVVPYWINETLFSKETNKSFRHSIKHIGELQIVIKSITFTLLPHTLKGEHASRSQNAPQSTITFPLLVTLWAVQLSLEGLEVRKDFVYSHTPLALAASGSTQSSTSLFTPLAFITCKTLSIATSSFESIGKTFDLKATKTSRFGLNHKLVTSMLRTILGV